MTDGPGSEVTMGDTQNRRPFEVALSFAGEDRAYVQKVAESLRDQSVSVFYDLFQEVDLWGKDLHARLQHIFAEAAEYVVIFVSEAYTRKVWTKHEHESAQKRALTEKREYILPARFDDAQIPSLSDSIGFIDLRKKSPSQFAVLIVEKIRGRADTTSLINSAPTASVSPNEHSTAMAPDDSARSESEGVAQNSGSKDDDFEEQLKRQQLELEKYAAEVDFGGSRNWRLISYWITGRIKAREEEIAVAAERKRLLITECDSIGERLRNNTPNDQESLRTRALWTQRHSLAEQICAAEREIEGRSATVSMMRAIRAWQWEEEIGELDDWRSRTTFAAFFEPFLERKRRELEQLRGDVDTARRALPGGSPQSALVRLTVCSAATLLLIYLFADYVYWVVLDTGTVVPFRDSSSSLRTMMRSLGAVVLNVGGGAVVVWGAGSWLIDRDSTKGWRISGLIGVFAGLIFLGLGLVAGNYFAFFGAATGPDVYQMGASRVIPAFGFLFAAILALMAIVLGTIGFKFFFHDPYHKYREAVRSLRQFLRLSERRERDIPKDWIRS